MRCLILTVKQCSISPLAVDHHLQHQLTLALTSLERVQNESIKEETLTAGLCPSIIGGKFKNMTKQLLQQPVKIAMVFHALSKIIAHIYCFNSSSSAGPLL